MRLFVNKNGDIKFGSIIGSSIFGVLAATILISACEEVDTGCTGVQVIMGSVQSETLNPGFHLKAPFVCDVVDVSNKIQKVEVDAGSVSKDLQDIASTLAVNYHLAPEKSVEMYKNIGLSYEDSILQPAIQESTKSIMAQYRAEELIQRRGEVSIAIADQIASKVSDYGIIIDEFNITNFKFSSAFNDAIEAKLVAEQNKIKAATENEQRVAAAEADAMEAKARAEGEAEAAKIKAQGEAEAIKAKADAEAEANRKISESITPELIDYNRIESWDGKLPSVMSGSDGNVIVDATT